MTQIINARWQMRYGTAAQWVASNEVLLADEMGHETDTGRAKIGNGIDGWNARPYAILGAIDFNGLADKYVLSWDATAGKWKAGPSVGGDAFAVASGTDTITATFAVAPTLVDGLQFKVRAAGANTTTAPTFNPNSLGALTLYKLGGVALAAGDISGAGHALVIRYRASPARYELLNPASVQQIAAGSHISIDSTDPRKPVVAVTGLSAGAGYGEGSAFPGSPGLNDKFYRTDLNLLCYYDGTRWLTTSIYGMQLQGINPPPTIASGAGWQLAPDQESIYVTSVQSGSRVPGTNNSTNYWNIVFASHDGTNLNTIATITTQGLSYASPDVFRLLSSAVNAAVSCRSAVITFNSVGSPGSIYTSARINYRLVVT